METQWAHKFSGNYNNTHTFWSVKHDFINIFEWSHESSHDLSIPSKSWSALEEFRNITIPKIVLGTQISK